jgi:hypothetical protein
MCCEVFPLLILLSVHLKTQVESCQSMKDNIELKIRTHSTVPGCDQQPQSKNKGTRLGRAKEKRCDISVKNIDMQFGFKMLELK